MSMRSTVANGAWKRSAEAVIGLQLMQIEVCFMGGDLASVVKDGAVEKAIRHDSPLALQQDAVADRESASLNSRADWIRLRVTAA